MIVVERKIGFHSRGSMAADQPVGVERVDVCVTRLACPGIACAKADVVGRYVEVFANNSLEVDDLRDLYGTVSRIEKTAHTVGSGLRGGAQACVYGGLAQLVATGAFLGPLTWGLGAVCGTYFAISQGLSYYTASRSEEAIKLIVEACEMIRNRANPRAPLTQAERNMVGDVVTYACNTEVSIQHLACKFVAVLRQQGVY